MFNKNKIKELERRIKDLSDTVKYHGDKLNKLERNTCIKIDDSERDNTFVWCQDDRKEVSEAYYGSSSMGMFHSYFQYHLSLHTVYRTIKLLFDYLGIKVEQKEMKPARIIKKKSKKK